MANNFIRGRNYRSDSGGQNHTRVWTGTFWFLNLGHGAVGDTFSSSIHLSVCLNLLGFLIPDPPPPPQHPIFLRGGEKKHLEIGPLLDGFLPFPESGGGAHSSVIGQFDWRQVVLSRGKHSHKASFGFKRSSLALSSNSTRWKLAPQTPTINLVPVSLTSTLSLRTVFSKLDSGQAQSWPVIAPPPPRHPPSWS